ncbi:MAG: TAT-variant-translocated molybdopterin oxidoreductase [Planctomycetes bacterium]|nr:TAT-variant-translocated molybdopterin oxidoreductase [Planctomycetota bacterium]
MTSVSPQPTPASGAPVYWRSQRHLDLGQLENSPEFQDYVAREFAEGADEAPDAVSRRGFLGAIAASVALAGMTSCRKPVTPIVAFNKRPEGFQPGLPEFYATALSRDGYGIGVVVKSSDGRPTKIEGNPDHPSSLGGSDMRLQAELLQLYDPARSAAPRGPMSHSHAEGEDHGGHAEHGSEGEHGGHGAEAEPDIWNEFAAMWDEKLRNDIAKQGDGMHFLVPPTTSPALQALIAKIQSGAMPKARFHFWTPLHADEELAGARIAFNKPVATQYSYDQATVILSLDSDFLATAGESLRSARQWAETRRVPAPGKAISRLYVVESSYSTTGAAADHRFRLRSGGVAALAFALCKALGASGDFGNQPTDGYTKNGKNWFNAVVKDLQAARGRSIVVAGPGQPPAVHAAVHAINQALGNVGKTVTYRPVAEGMQHGAVAGLQELRTALDAGKVDTLFCLGANPVLDAPADLGFAEAIGKATLSVHVGEYDDETGRHCQWHFPLAHELEAWGDLRAADGTVAIQQPLVRPLHGGVSVIEFLGFLMQEPNFEGLQFARDGVFGLDLVQSHWRTTLGVSDFDTAWWPRALHDGFVADSAFQPETPAIDGNAIAAAARSFNAPTGFEIVLRRCPKMDGGRFANNSWMQETPDPLTKLTWDNAAMLSMATAERLGVENGDKLAIEAAGAKVEIPAWIVPGHADDSISIFLGWGRELTEDCKVARGSGFDAYPLRSSTAQWIVSGATVSKVAGSYKLVCTQEHGTMAGRELVREADVATNDNEHRWAQKMSPLDKAAALHGGEEADLNHSLWTERYQDGGQDDQVKRSAYQWGMVIDLNACTGCSACVTACVAENNIPMVGKIQVSRNREMFWIRADRYFASSPDDELAMAEDPAVANMPVPCMQCENAPCEAVCPVAATVHSPDGLNAMVYNRCIGTRYCSNNCPYKVRRFNYLDYLGHVPETKRMAFNPDVTVRSRGVMEKCTYCTQRINGARITAKLAGQTVGDAEGQVPVTTACAQACPTGAITFGNLKDEKSKVRQLRDLDLNYGLLSELNTKPRTTYLGRVKNPNPELA